MPGFISNTVQVHVAAFDPQNGEYLHLALQRSEKLELYPLLWQVITGTLEASETAVESAFRELKEETGISAEDIYTVPYIASFYDPYSDMVNNSPVFGVVLDDIPIVTISDEHRDYKWLAYDDCLEMLPLPSHKEGTRIFMETILKKAGGKMFLYRGNKADGMK